jgi:16S rRNA (cytosine967-C5)-methyltransferase
VFEHFFSRAPTHALLHQAVELCKHVGKRNEAKFVNAILRKVIETEMDRDPYNDLPEWLGKRWKKQKDWVESLREQPHFAFHYQSLERKSKSTRTEEAVSIGEQTLELMSYPELKGRISEQEGYEDGDWWIMNPAAAYPTELLSDVRDLSGLKALDMCAAPGGKSFCLASKGVEVIATDSSNRRLDVMQENIDRLGFDIRLKCHDWENDCPSIGLFDIVVLDAPCTGTGVIRKHPEIKWRRAEKDILAASTLQHKLLNEAQKHVKEGGLLLYCVCSVLYEEGKGMMKNLDSEEWTLLKAWNSLDEKNPKLDGFQAFLMERIAK